MDDPPVVSRDEWVAARKQLLAREKEFTRQRDALNAERRRLPMTEIGKQYLFEGRDGTASLLDLFEDRGQLLTYHFMFDPDWDEDESSLSFTQHCHNLSFLPIQGAVSTSVLSSRWRPLCTLVPILDLGSYFGQRDQNLNLSPTSSLPTLS